METAIKEKQDYLWGYQKAKNRCRRKADYLREVKQSELMPSSGYSTMPRGSRQDRDLSDYAVKMEKAEIDYSKAQEECLTIMQEIIETIEKLKKDNEKDVLIYRYIKAMDWADIAKTMGYCLQHVFKIHNTALKNIKIRVNAIE